MGDAEYDLVTIGAGSGGTRASRFATSIYHKKVACVELPFGFVSSDEVGGAGGTCVIRGCVPKKLLVFGAQFAEEFRDSRGFGWGESSPPHDWKHLVACKAKEIQRLNSVYQNIIKNAGVDLIEGRGTVVDPHTVEVTLPDGSKKTLKTKNILVATGGYATKIDIPGAEHAITSDEALALDSLPNSKILVIGAGYIACEFAGIFNGVGADTHLMFRADKVLRGFDDECRAQVQENLASRGVHLHAQSLPTKIEPSGDGYTVTFKGADGLEQSMEVGLVMMATGRLPRIKGLGLEAAGVEVSTNGAVKVDAYSRTNVPSIWAIGDVTNRINLTPVALAEGMAVVKTMFTDEPSPADYHWVASAVFSQPPLASVGYSEERAVLELEGTLDVYTSRFRPMKNTLSGREEKSLMKLVVHRESDRVVGCHMVGPDSPEIMQGFAVAIKGGATKALFDSTIGIHPTAAEEFVTMRSKSRSLEGKGTSKL